MTSDLGQSLYEVSVILDNTDKRLVDKIPEKFLNAIRKKANPNTEFIFNKNKKLQDQEITNLTRGIIALIYRDYFCDEKQRIIYNKYYKTAVNEAELEKSKKYSVDNIFEKHNNEIKEEYTQLIPYYKEGLWAKIRNMFLKLFNKFFR